MARKLTFAPLIDQYTEHLHARNYSKHTIARTHHSLRRFADWCIDRGLDAPQDVTKPVIDRYVRFLYYFRKPNGEPLTFRTQSNNVAVVCIFFRWLVRADLLAANPASEIERPRVGQTLPKHVLTRQEAERVLAQPDVDTDPGVRDRAILETLYSTGIRRAELVNLDRFDLDIGRGCLTVRQGKGNKDRIIPIGERALDWINRYLVDVRPTFLVDAHEEALFINQYGERLSPDALSGRVTAYVDAAHIDKKGSCHLFRHTMATLMLEGGADIRFVQQMLGHDSIKATQIYTHVSIQQLKRVHELTHPSARRGRLHDDEGDDFDPVLAADDAHDGG